MPVPSSGVITLQDIANEFGGATPHGLNEYYAGGSYVPAGTKNKDGVVIPSSGAISFSNFYGASKYIAPVVQNPLNPVPSRSITTATATSLSFVMSSDGTWYYDNTPTVKNTFLLAGNISDVEARIAITSGSVDSNAYTNWKAISGPALQITGGKSARFAIEFRNKNTLASLGTTTNCLIELTVAYVTPVVRNPLSPVPLATGTAYSNQSCQTTFEVLPSGGWQANGLDSTSNGAWLTTGLAKDVQVKFTPTSGSFSSNGASVWVDVTSTIVATVVSTSTTKSKAVTFTVQFREKSTTTILSTTTGCRITATTSSSNPV